MSDREILDRIWSALKVAMEYDLEQKYGEPIEVTITREEKPA